MAKNDERESCRPDHHQMRLVELNTTGTNSGWADCMAVAGAAGKLQRTRAQISSGASLTSWPTHRWPRLREENQRHACAFQRHDLDQQEFQYRLIAFHFAR